MRHDDTGINIQETVATLCIQQRQLLDGKRRAQMFPTGTREMALPTGLERHENERGAFHFWPSQIGSQEIDRLSAGGRENEILLLGPYSKADVAERVATGEELLAVCEITPEGTEVRSAAGTASTAPAQIQYFEGTKDAADNKIVVADFASVLRNRLET